ncbi:IclR family transcriptional regulator [Pseudonocardia nigra]|uniref:IclR family transcriptional regulator n=1 Tax=Pseudonocardia nigra TaxID=1921578 RepID=UPI001C5ED287|nr:IclR family transcriptional regulator [Pseudonocardia nigra]
MSQSVQRAAEVLEFVSMRPRTQVEVAEHLDVHRSTALRILATLTECGLARRREDGRYGVGYRLAGLAQLAIEQFDLVAVARPHLRALGAACAHTIHLAALDGRSIVYAEKIDQPGMVRLYSQVGQKVSLHTAGVAKAILAFQPGEAVEAMLDTADFVRHTDTTITSRERYRAELRAVAERGWAVDDGEHEDFVHCVAMPVRDASGGVTAAVSITALKARASREDLERLLPRLAETTTTISEELGWRP